MRRGGWREGETARAVEGVDDALRPAAPVLVLVFRVSREGRWEDVGVGEWAREEAIDGRGEDRVDMLSYLVWSWNRESEC